MLLHEDVLREISELEILEQEKEERWIDSWRESVETIKKLYTL